ncbi:MAG TPA: carboxypeptidase-like regulatory domain-containing protein [Yeosuana sp.]
MKQLITLLLLTFSSISFAQNTGLIVGKVTDKELNNEPLMFASISVKDTAIASETDITGIFLIENLAEGDYTLVCKFIGYETKELTIHVGSMQPTEINLSLAASTISLNELAALSSVAKKDDRTAVALNN